jgi:hypothetical protein
MAVHHVSLNISHEIPIGGTDIALPVYRGKKLLGTLTISQGGVDWKKAYARKSKPFDWTRFAELMENA